MLSFTMSGQRFDFDEERDLSAAEMFAFEDHAGVELDQEALGLLAAQLATGNMTGRGLRVLACIAWIAHRRAGGALEFGPFCETIAPGTIKIVEDPAPIGGGPPKASPTRQRPASRTSSKRK